MLMDNWLDLVGCIQIGHKSRKFLIMKPDAERLFFLFQSLPRVAGIFVSHVEKLVSTGELRTLDTFGEILRTDTESVHSVLESIVDALQGHGRYRQPLGRCTR